MEPRTYQQFPYSNDRDLDSTTSAYSLNNYQEEAGLTAEYPGAGEGGTEAFSYLSLKLNGEAGEVGEAFAKYLRGDYDFREAKRRIASELGDVLWYVSQLASELDLNLGDIAEDNIQKLRDRKARNVIKGSGNDR